MSCTPDIDHRKGILMSRLSSPRGAGMLFISVSIPSASNFTPTCLHSPLFDFCNSIPLLGLCFPFACHRSLLIHPASAPAGLPSKKRHQFTVHSSNATCRRSCSNPRGNQIISQIQHKKLRRIPKDTQGYHNERPYEISPASTAQRRCRRRPDPSILALCTRFYT